MVEQKSTICSIICVLKYLYYGEEMKVNELGDARMSHEANEKLMKYFIRTF